MTNHAFSLGDRLQDGISGFTGIATGVTEYVNGCVQYLLEAPLDEHGKRVNEWLDEERLVLVAAGAFSLSPTRPGGGPPAPVR